MAAPAGEYLAAFSSSWRSARPMRSASIVRAGRPEAMSTWTGWACSNGSAAAIVLRTRSSTAVGCRSSLIIRASSCATSAASPIKRSSWSASSSITVSSSHRCAASSGASDSSAVTPALMPVSGVRNSWVTESSRAARSWSCRRAVSACSALAASCRARSARLLASRAVSRKAASAIQFCVSAIRKVPRGGRKKKLKASVAATEVATASHSPQ